METHPPKERVWPWIVRISGLAIVIYETVVEHADRPSLLFLAGAMILGTEFVVRGRGDGK